MTMPGIAAEIATSCSCPKLIVRGSKAEHPKPASANARTPRPGEPLGRAATSASEAASQNGRIRYVQRVGNQRRMAANRTRPTVTMAQNVARATEAQVGAEEAGRDEQEAVRE